MAKSESLTRQQVVHRYGFCRTAMYDWVGKGILPPADIVLGPRTGPGSRSRWSISLLARWEKANAPILERVGVYSVQSMDYVAFIGAIGAVPPLLPAKFCCGSFTAMSFGIGTGRRLRMQYSVGTRLWGCFRSKKPLPAGAAETT